MNYHNYLQEISKLENKKKTKGWKKIKIMVFRNFTVEPVLNVIKVELMKKKILPIFQVSNYNDYLTLFQNNIFKKNLNKFDFFLVLLWRDSISEELNHNFDIKKLNRIKGILSKFFLEIKTLLSMIRKASSAPILYFNNPKLNTRKLGLIDKEFQHGSENLINNFNKNLSKINKKFNSTYMLDLEHIFYNFGYSNCIDLNQWYGAMLPFSHLGIVEVGKEISKYNISFFSANHKLIILDADNTLWGGILGEEGENKIKLNNQVPGVYFKNFQRQILNLKNRGVLLALCTKNNLSDIDNLFKKNKNLILKKNDFAVIESNWKPKNINVKNILSSNVLFVDDNVYEINLIVKYFKEMDVLHLDTHPSTFVNRLNEIGKFDNLKLTQEDQIRTKLYLQEAKREKIKNNNSDISSYLKSLKIKLFVKKASKNDFSRLSQLTQKTNQFNSTTIRMSEQDLLKFYFKKDFELYKISTKDIIGESGIVGFLLTQKVKKNLLVKNFLMSCRVIGRNIENNIMIFLKDYAKKHNLKLVSIHLIRNSKNFVIQDFFSKMKKEKVLFEEKNKKRKSFV